MSKTENFFLSSVWIITLVLIALQLCGCTAFQSLTDATKAKSIALGSDTWGGGVELSVATPENPVPTIDGWFGRRKVWYVSVKDKQTGEAAANVVRASNSPLELNAGTEGIKVEQKAKNSSQSN